MRRLCVVALVALPLLAETTAQPGKDDEFLNRLYAVRTYHEIANSPAGARMAWSEKDHGIWTANLDGSNRKQLTTADDEGIAWSPDSKTLAYLSEKSGQKQLHAGATQLTHVKGFLAEPKWS